MSTQWVDAGHRDGCRIFAGTHNPLTKRELPHPDYLVTRGPGERRFFPGNIENGTRGGIMDRWFCAGGFDA